MSHPETVPVEQVDRMSAWPFRAECYGHGDKNGWMNGKYDHVRPIQAFARHRIAALQAAMSNDKSAPPVVSGDMVMVERAELADYADVIGNLIGELSDPGTGALAAHYRIKQLLAAAPKASPVEGEAAANDQHLIDFLRREAEHSGVWFADQLSNAADRLATLSTEAVPVEREAIVTWLNMLPDNEGYLPGEIAARIEAGEHLNPSLGGGGR